MTEAVTGTDVEVTELTGIDLEGAPPCTCVTTLGLFVICLTWKCGKPSAMRVLVRCGACGRRDSAFLCRLHAAGFRNRHLVQCRHCGKQGKCSSTVA